MTDSMTTDPPLDHDTIAEQSLLERYHLGTLTAADEERFEAHLMDCAACQEELVLQRSFVRGLKEVAATDAAAARDVARISVLAWLWRRRMWLAAGSMVAVLASVGIGDLLRQRADLESQVATLESDLAAATSGGGIPGIPSPTALPVALLTVLRSADESVTTLTEAVTASGSPWTLAVDVGLDPRLERFHLTLLDARAATPLHTVHDLSPNALEVIQLALPSGFLPPGDYRLRVDGSMQDGTTVEVGTYAFRIVPGGAEPG